MSLPGTRWPARWPRRSARSPPDADRTLLQDAALTAVDSYRAVVIVLRRALGVVLAVRVRAAVAADGGDPRSRAIRAAGIAGRARSGLHRSRPVVLRLSALFALDAFGGGFVVQSFAAYWFHLRFGVDPADAGRDLLLGRTCSPACRPCSRSRLAARIGLVNTMVFTHLPSNVLLMLVPLMPTLAAGDAVLLLRFSISQMDVPTRQSYTMAVVAPEERAAAGGITGVARTIGAAISPLFAGLMFSHPSLINVPFFIAGTLKIVYDLLLFRRFARSSRPKRPPSATR